METSPCELPPTKIECKATIQNPEPMASTRNDNGRPDGAEGNEVKGAVLSSSISSDGDKSSSTDSEGNAKPVSINGGAESTTAIKSSYRDYSRVPPERKDASLSLTALTASTKEHTFPVKLHMILSSPDFHEIIGWLPHGRSWRILQQKAFEERIIPLYFRHGRYSSFARQVNGWGFRRITHGTDYNSYYHELFLRGIPYLCDKMRRLTSKDIEKRKKEGDEPTPDFYALSRDSALPESSTQVRSTAASLPPAMAAPAASGHPPPSLADVEMAILEKRKAEIMDRINLLSSSQGSRPDASLLSQAASLGLQLNRAASLGQQAPASLGQQELALLHQRLSSAQRTSPPAQASFAPNGNPFFQQPLQQQQSHIASLLAALGGNGSGVGPPSAPAPPPPPAPSTGTDISALLQQAGLAALLQQGGAGGLGQPNLANLVDQLLKSGSAGGNAQPARAPAPSMKTPVPSAASSFAQAFGALGGGQVNAQSAPAHGGAPAPVNMAQLLSNNNPAGSNAANLQRQLLEARLTNVDLTALGLGGLAGYRNQSNGNQN